jgi:hypothetical protein
MSKKNTTEIEKFRQQYRENTEKVRKAGIFINKTSGMGKDNYFSYKGRAYDSHAEAVEDIVKRENL